MKRDAQTSILQACARFLRRHLEPVMKRLAGLEERALTIEKLQDSVQVRDLVASMLSDQIKALQLPAGPPGAPGKDAEPVVVADVVRELVACHELRPVLDLLVTEAVSKHMEANPVRDGRDGKDGERGPAGEKGADGKPGIGVADLMIDRDGALVATFEDGRMKSLGRVEGKDGAPGAAGRDGVAMPTVDWDGERTFTIKAHTGEVLQVVKMPVLLDKGYWRDGMDAEQGDVVTNGGSAWVALRSTKAKPCAENKDDWRLLARKGRDASPVKTHEPAPSGPVKLG